MATWMTGSRSHRDSDAAYARQWRLLAQVGASLRANGGQAESIKHLMLIVPKVTGFVSAALYLPVAVGDDFHLVAENGMTTEDQQRIAALHLPQQQMRAVFQAGQALHPGRSYRIRSAQLQLVASWTRTRPTTASRAPDHWTPQDTLILPLRTGPDLPLNGFLALDTPEDARAVHDNPSEQWIDLVENLSDLFANVLENHHLFETADNRRQLIETGLTEIMRQLAQAQRGNFAVRIPLSHTFLDGIADQFNQMIAQTRDTLREVRTASHTMNDSASMVRQLANSAMENAQVQVQRIEAASTSMRAIAGSIENMATTSIEAETVAESARDFSEDGRVAAEAAAAGMRTQRDLTMQSMQKMKRLAENLQEIEGIVRQMTEFTKQMNFLAINASIKASRPSDPSLDFARIAQQMRTQASNSADAALQITERVRTIQSEANAVMTTIAESAERVVEQTESVFEAGTALQSIAEITREIATLNHTIRDSAQEEAGQSNALSQGMVEIIAYTEDTCERIRQIVQAMVHLVGLADTLDRKIGQFTLDNQ